MPVLIQLTKIEIGYDATHKIELNGVGSIVWGDSDPWVPTEFPGAENVTVFQHIRPVRIEGILECFDVDSFITAFYKTDIQVAAGSQYAISESGERKKIEYFHVTGKKHDGSTKEYVFTGVRVRQVESPLLSVDEPKANPFRVHFYAEKVEEFP